MTSPRAPSLAVFARRVESALRRVRGETPVLSPRDWSCLVRWHAAGIPLALVVETIDDLAKNPARRRGPGLLGPRPLVFASRAVEEAWEGVRDGRAISTTVASMMPPMSEAVRSWRQRAAESSSPLREILANLLSGLAAGESPAEIDRGLDEVLEGAADPELVGEARRNAERQTAPFRARMDGATLEATRRRSVLDRLRRDLGLPRLSLRDPRR